MKLRWTKKYCAVVSNSTDNPDLDQNNIAFTIKDTKLDFPVVTPLAKDNQKETSVYWNEYKTKKED